MTELKIETTELKVIATECHVDIVKAEETTLGLKPTIDERALLIEEFETVSKLELTLENLPTFRELRIKFQKNRTLGIDKWHKAAKEVPLRMSQLIDAVKRNETQINETHEEFLQKAEKHFEILEQKRLDALQIERAKEISKYLDAEHIDNDLSNMNDMVWDAYLQGTKLNYDNKIAAEMKAEEDLIEAEKVKIEEDKRIRAENERLEKEAIKAERKRIAEAKEYERLENIRLEKEETERKERELKAEKLRKENEAKLQKECEAREKIEREERLKREKLQAELKAKEETERKEKQLLLDKEQARIKAEKDALLAPDKEKLIILSNKIMSIDMPELKAREANDIMLNVVDLLSKIDSYIKEKVKNL